MGLLDTISGKAIEEKVSEYTEVYGEVLLGIHRDLEKQELVTEQLRDRLQSEVQLRTDNATAVENKLNGMSIRMMGFERTCESHDSRIAEVCGQVSALRQLEQNVTQVAQDLKLREGQLSEALAEHAKHLRKVLHLYAVVGVVAVAGVLLWIIR